MKTVNRFGISSLLVLTAAFAISFVYIAMPSVAAGILLGLLPLIAIYGLTAPAKGTSLDVTVRPGIRAMIQLWGICTAIVLTLMLAGALSTDFRQAIDRVRFRQSIKTPALVDTPPVVYGLDR